MKRLERNLFKLFKTLTSLMLIFASVLVFAEVFFRYVVGQAHGWSEEMLRFLLIWMTFLGTYLATREEQHLAIRVFRNRLPEKVQKYLKLVGDLLTIAMFSAFTVIGIQYVLKFRSDTSPLLEIPLSVVYLVMPVGALLFIFQTLYNVFVKRCSSDEA